MKGKFITFEGSEGCGKSTQSRLLYAYLKKKGFGVVYLREPGSSEIGERIRKILLDAKNKDMNQICEMLLYMAARAQVVQDTIKPMLRKGKIVICDRFLDSTVAYQGYGLGIPQDLIRRIAKYVTQGISPDLTIFLDLPVKAGLSYRKFAQDRIEKRSFKYHARVRKGYLSIARKEPQRVKVVRVEKEKNKTQKKIRLLIERLLS
jgi:dTMP kinase